LDSVNPLKSKLAQDMGGNIPRFAYNRIVMTDPVRKWAFVGIADPNNSGLQQALKRRCPVGYFPGFVGVWTNTAPNSGNHDGA
jgi:hypothetical protein